MKRKTKFMAIVMAMCFVITLGVFGILAVKTLNMSVGGNIVFNAEGIAFTVGNGEFYKSDKTTAYAGIVTQTNKMQGFSMDTDTKESDVEDAVESWANLELKLDSQGDAVLKFKVTNDMTDKDLYVHFSVTLGTNKNDNMSIVAPTSEKIEATQYKDIEIIFDILDDSINAGLTGFKIQVTFSDSDDNIPVDASKPYINEHKLNDKLEYKPVQLSTQNPNNFEVELEVSDLSALVGSEAIATGAVLNFSAAQMPTSDIDITITATAEIDNETFYAFRDFHEGDNGLLEVCPFFTNYASNLAMDGGSTIWGITVTEVTNDNDVVTSLNINIPISRFNPQTRPSGNELEFAIIILDQNFTSSFGYLGEKEVKTVNFEISTQNSINFNEVVYSENPEKTNYVSFGDLFSTSLATTELMGQPAFYANYTLGYLNQDANGLRIEVEVAPGVNPEDVYLMLLENHFTAKTPLWALALQDTLATSTLEGNTLILEFPIKVNSNRTLDIALIASIDGAYSEDKFDITCILQETGYESCIYELKTETGKDDYYVLTGIKSSVLSEIEIADAIDGIPVKEIGERVFQDSNVKVVKMGENITKINDLAFIYTRMLSTIELPANLKYIGKSAFWNSGLVSLTLPEGLIEFGESAFSDTLIRNAYIPSSVSVISYSAFQSCDYLTDVQISNGVTTIEDRAFRYTKALQEIYLPATITSIGATAFESSALKTIYFAGTQAQWDAIGYTNADVTVVCNTPYPSQASASPSITFENSIEIQLPKVFNFNSKNKSINFGQ